MSWGRVQCVIALVVVSLTAVCAAGAPLRQDPVDAVISLPDGAEVTLDPIYVHSVIGPYAFVGDVWCGNSSLPVYTDAALHGGDTIRVSGVMATAAGKRVLRAGYVGLYTDIHGRPVPPMPPDVLADSSFMLTPMDLQSLACQAAVSLMDDPILPPPSEDPQPPAPLNPPVGSIAKAKVGGESVTLTGKVVTAVFYAPGTQAVSYFYIQEPELDNPCASPCGIKVIPQYAAPVEPGNLVTIKGDVVPSSAAVAECYIDATSVTCTGSNPIRQPLGLNQRAAAPGAFGYQQALCQDLAGTPSSGLSTVGTRVRLWGKVSVIDDIYWMDDGSGLASKFEGVTHSGVRVIFDGAPTVADGDTNKPLTGILGAEISDNNFPVPVLRVPKPVAVLPCDGVICVRPFPLGNDTNNGTDWTDAVATIAKALELADDGADIWVASGTYACQAQITSSVSLYGGFAPADRSRAERDWKNNVTILDSSLGEQAYAPVLQISAGQNAIVSIDGFTIRNGQTTSATNFCGGGICCLSGSPVIANNRFVCNSASGGNGGAVYCVGSSPLIWNNTFGDAGLPNTATAGSAIYLSSCTSSSIVAENTVRCNTTPADRGAVECDASPASVLSNIICDNTGTGVRVSGNTASVERNTISGNSGCGVYSAYSAAVIANNVISSNKQAGVWAFFTGPAVINNTIVSNSTGVDLQYVSSPVICNNIIAFSRYGVKGTVANLSLDYNCFYNPRGDNYTSDISPGTHNVDADPKLLSITGSDSRVRSSSPCIDAGSVNYLQPGWRDVSGSSRIQGASVDIGAYEASPAAPPYVISFAQLSSVEAAYGTAVNLSAVVTAGGSTAGIASRPVTFEVVSGPAALTITSTQTASTGGMTAVTSLSATAYGRIEVKATTPDGLGGTSEDRLVLWFYDPAKTPVDMFLCIDCTDSMGQGTGAHRAHESIQALLDYLVGQGVRLRVGGVKFNDGDTDFDTYFDPDSINEDQKEPLDRFTNLDDMQHWWLMNGYSTQGAYAEELQLDALYYAAQQMTDHAATGSRKFIVLVTDSPYYYAGDNTGLCSLTKAEVITALQNSGSSVYISLWDTSNLAHNRLQNLYYYDLNANLGEFDTASYDAGAAIKYPFTRLRARILAE